MSATVEFSCWNCGSRLTNILTPIARNEQCSSCNRDVHVCRQCKFYDTSLANSCAEPIADPVTEKERANFCGYFTVNADPVTTSSSSNDETELNALFGLGSEQEGSGSPRNDAEAKSALDELFGLGDDEK